jgi:hypothetical protein
MRTVGVAPSFVASVALRRRSSGTMTVSFFMRILLILESVPYYMPRINTATPSPVTGNEDRAADPSHAVGHRPGTACLWG